MSLFESFSLIALILTVLEWAIRIGALFIVPRNRKPTSATAWLLLIFLFPFLGLILFLIIGSPKLPKVRRDAQKTLDNIIVSTLGELRSKDKQRSLLNAEAPKTYNHIAKLAETLGHLPVFDGNSVEVLPEYNETLQTIVAEIDKATTYVHIEYFIVALDNTTKPFFDALDRAVKRGVTVRVLYDSLSTHRYPKVKEMIALFKTIGVHAEPMLALKLPGRGYVRPDLRNHRKIVIIDGTTGFTGSQNMIDRTYHRKDDIYYDELVVRIKGPVVLQLEAVFLTDWYSETGELLDYRKHSSLPKAIVKKGSTKAQVLPSGPGYDDENNLKLFTELIHAAKEKIVITNPYFVPDDALLTAITSAAKRGVDVTMINSEVMDQWMVGHAQRSFYEALLSAGVHIYWYNAPILLHSKFITVDSDIATIGSSNLDIRSFELDLEITLVVYDADVVAKLREVESTYLNKSKKLSLEEWQLRPRKMIMLDNIARLTSALQ